MDLIFKGTATAFHGVNTYESIKHNITGYWKLIDTYNEKILSRGAIWSSDTLIVNTSKRAVKEVEKSVLNLYKSYLDLSLIISGESECTTANLMVILNSINESMDHIDYTIYHAYLDIHTYMTIRLGYWKRRYSWLVPSKRSSRTPIPDGWLLVMKLITACKTRSLLLMLPWVAAV